MSDAGVRLAEVDTHIDANNGGHPSRSGLARQAQDRFHSMFDSAMSRAQISGKLGDALDDYIDDLSSGCHSASEELTTTIDVIRSWGDQVSWRKQDMADYRDQATTGGLTVQDDRYISPPESVSSPGKRPDGGTADEKSAWESANNDYESYLEKKKLFDKLSTKVSKAHKKLTDWAAEHMTVSPDSPLFELTTKSLQDGAIKFAEHGIENVYYGHAFDTLVSKAVPAAMKRAALKSDNPQKKAGKKSPNSDSVSRRAKASASSKAIDTGIATKAGKFARGTGTVLTLALAGWEISNGTSPSRVALETTAGYVGSTIVIAGAAALAPEMGAVILGVLGSAALSYSVRKAYGSWIPLQTRERIDEGISDVYETSTEGIGDKTTSAWKRIFG